MREAFKEIVDGWTLISGLADLTDRIERAAEWIKQSGPLEADEEATIKLMIDAQIARSDPRGGDDDYDDDGDSEFDEEEDALMNCHMGADGQCGAAGSEWCDWDCPIMVGRRRP